MNKKIAKLRSQIIQEIRNFFFENNYIEVDTPLLSPDLIPESSIEIFKTQYLSDFRNNKELYLIPSPEIFMKKLIGQDYGDIFQISKSFRNEEQISPFHNPEFTMLEWYSLNQNYMDSAKLTEKLLNMLSESFDPKKKLNFSKKIEYLSMEEAFNKYADINLNQLIENNNFDDILKKIGCRQSDTDSFEENFNKIFLTLVEPELPKNNPLILYNYPSGIDCLAKDIPNSPWKERWELYIDGIEIANCYTEEVKEKKVASYFATETSKKSYKKLKHNIDNKYPNVFSETYPKCSGVAIGIDRLIMIISKNKDIKGVIHFPFSDIL